MGHTRLVLVEIGAILQAPADFAHSNDVPCRVRQTAAAIAGHHAQETAKRKIEELATTTVRLSATCFLL